MADGYARAKGKPGVCLVTSGPGATNTITGLATAHMDGVPIVCVTGQVPMDQIGTDAFQEADMTGICRAVTKHSFLLQSADEVPETVAEAFYIATHGKPGPVVIDIPKNVQRAFTSAQYPERVSLRAFHPESTASSSQMARFAKLVNEAKRPVIYAGGGVIASGAAQDVANLAHRAQIPVATTLMGLGAFNENDPLALRLAGMHGSAAANYAINDSDLIIALGVRFSDRVTGKLAAYAKRAKIIHVDCDPASIGKNVSVHLGIVADVKDVLTTVNSRIKSAEHADWLAKIAEWKKKRPVSYKPMHPNVIMPQAVIEAVDKATKGRAAVVTDVGQHQMWAAQFFRHNLPRHFISSGGMGTMGFGIPAAIGAAIARPDHQTVAICGDGGAQMTFEELVVAVEHKLPVTFIVVNNRHGAPVARAVLRQALLGVHPLRARPHGQRAPGAGPQVRLPAGPQEARRGARGGRLPRDRPREAGADDPQGDQLRPHLLRGGDRGAARERVSDAAGRTAGGRDDFRMKEEIHRLSCYVENKPGVLARIVGLISGRGYNIQTLSVGPTEDGTVSRMKIDVVGDDKVIRQIILQLNNQVNVIEVTSRRRA